MTGETTVAVKSTPETIRQMLAAQRAYIHEKLKTLTGDEVWRLGVDLSILLANVSEVCADKDFAYNKVLERYMFGRLGTPVEHAIQPAKSAAAAEIRARATIEWHEAKMWELEMEAVTQLIQSLKKRFNEIARESGGSKGWK